MALVIGLGAARLFPVALIVAAALMPVLTLVYLYDVDVYGNDPIWAYGWSVVWGAGAGVALGFFSRVEAATGPALFDRGSTDHVLIGGLAVPALGVAATILGLLVALRRRRLGEALDGATLAGATAATLASAEALMVGVGVLSGGMRPAGAAAPWVIRLVAIAVATPVLAMGALSLVGAATWLRYRAPIRDRRALGLLGQPLIAALLASVLLVAGALGETFLPAGAWLALLAALDLVALVLLRRVLHVGLLEEASEREIGDPIRCANCGAITPLHTFCSVCGISLKALPLPAAASALVRGSFSGRLAGEANTGWPKHRRILTSGVALGIVLAAGLAAGALAAAQIASPRCRPGVPCGTPPLALSRPPHYTVWRSAGLGFSLRYDGRHWVAAGEGPGQLTLQPAGGGVGALIVQAAPAAQASPAALASGEVGSLKGQLLGLAADPDPSDQLLGTNIGFTPGPGAAYTATASTPQGPQSPVSLAVIAAGDSRISIVVTVIAPGNDAAERASVYQSADDIINSIRWPAP